MLFRHKFGYFRHAATERAHAPPWLASGPAAHAECVYSEFIACSPDSITGDSASSSWSAAKKAGGSELAPAWQKDITLRPGLKPVAWSSVPVYMRPVCFNCGANTHYTHLCTKQALWTTDARLVDLAAIAADYKASFSNTVPSIGKLQAAYGPQQTPPPAKPAFSTLSKLDAALKKTPSPLKSLMPLKTVRTNRSTFNSFDFGGAANKSAKKAPEEAKKDAPKAQVAAQQQQPKQPKTPKPAKAASPIESTPASNEPKE